MSGEGRLGDGASQRPGETYIELSGGIVSW